MMPYRKSRIAIREVIFDGIGTRNNIFWNNGKIKFNQTQMALCVTVVQKRR